MTTQPMYPKGPATFEETYTDAISGTPDKRCRIFRDRHGIVRNIWLADDDGRDDILDAWPLRTEQQPVDP